MPLNTIILLSGALVFALLLPPRLASILGAVAALGWIALAVFVSSQSDHWFGIMAVMGVGILVLPFIFGCFINRLGSAFSLRMRVGLSTLTASGVIGYLLVSSYPNYLPLPEGCDSSIITLRLAEHEIEVPANNPIEIDIISKLDEPPYLSGYLSSKKTLNYLCRQDTPVAVSSVKITFTALGRAKRLTDRKNKACLALSQLSWGSEMCETRKAPSTFGYPRYVTFADPKYSRPQIKRPHHDAITRHTKIDDFLLTVLDRDQVGKNFSFEYGPNDWPTSEDGAFNIECNRIFPTKPGEREYLPSCWASYRNKRGIDVGFEIRGTPDEIPQKAREADEKVAWLWEQL